MEKRNRNTRTTVHASERPAARGRGSRASDGKKRKVSVSSRLRSLRRGSFFVFAGLMVLLLAFIIVKSVYFKAPDAQEVAASLDSYTFHDGIAVNGIPVGGMTYGQAREAVYDSVAAGLNSINITVAHDTHIWVLTAADLGVSTTLDEVLTQALLLGRGDTVSNNNKALDELAESGASYTVDYVADESKLTQTVGRISAVLDAPAEEPYAEADAWAAQPAFEFFEGAEGYTLDEPALAAQIATCLKNRDYSPVLTPELELTPPVHDVDWLKANTQLRSSFQTSFGKSSSLRNAARVGNIRKAATLLNGAKVGVGEEFNFNAYIGPRTEKGGWPLAPGIVNGNSYEMQAGGGICQVSTTLYNALICSGAEIEITERYHHSWPSSYADYGLDSTVTGSAESGKSLNFINNTGAPLYIFAYCDSEAYTMTIMIYGEPLPEGVTYMTRGVTLETVEPGEPTIVENPEWPLGYEKMTITARKGYVAEAYRDTYKNGELAGSELLYTDKYRVVNGEKTMGTGDPSLPKPED